MVGRYHGIGGQREYAYPVQRGIWQPIIGLQVKPAHGPDQRNAGHI